MNSGRNIEFQVIQNLIGQIAFGATGGLVKLGDLSKGTIVEVGNGDVVTAFNAGTTNVMDIVGFKKGSTVSNTASPDYTFLASTSFVAGTATPSPNTKTLVYKKEIQDDIEVYVRYAPTGTAATAGLANAWLTFLTPMEGAA